MNKNQIRVDMKAFLGKLTPEERHARSIAACNNLVSVREFKYANLIMIFMSMPTEVETSTLALKAWQEGKSIAVPRVDWEGKKMEPVEINSLDICKPGSTPGVREPIEGTVVPLDMIEMIVIPGLAFDRNGYRVGRGRGFYDRFLSQQDFQGKRCGLCFQEQLLDCRIPFEPHDIAMDIIVTDKEVIHCGAGGGGNR